MENAPTSDGGTKAPAAKITKKKIAAKGKGGKKRKVDSEDDNEAETEGETDAVTPMKKHKAIKDEPVDEDAEV